MSQILVETELDKGCSFCQIGFQNRPGNQLFSFPDARKNPVIYRSWCDILVIDPAEEKAKKPLVCHQHFNPKYVHVGKLDLKAIPWRKKVRVTTNKKRNKRDKASKQQRIKRRVFNKNRVNKSLEENREASLKATSEDNDFLQEDLEYEFVNDDVGIKEEPFEELTIEESRFADQTPMFPPRSSPIMFLPATAESSPTKTNFKKPSTSKPRSGQKNSQREMTDEEFLESLLPAVLKMTNRQKEIFHRVMQLKYKQS